MKWDVGHQMGMEDGEVMMGKRRGGGGDRVKMGRRKEKLRRAQGKVRIQGQELGMEGRMGFHRKKVDAWPKHILYVLLCDFVICFL
jgi:hypothetical protein